MAHVNNHQLQAGSGLQRISPMKNDTPGLFSLGEMIDRTTTIDCFLLMPVDGFHWGMSKKNSLHSM
jgi:hypothetical protein